MASGLSFVTYTGVAAQQDYAVTFPALRGDHIFVDIDGVNTADISLNLALTTVTINTPAIAGGEFIKVYRVTPRTQAGRLVDFEAGSVITESDLDTTYLQLLYIVQESIDTGTLSLKQSDDGGSQWDAEGNRIINVGDPVDDQDAVTKSFLNTALGDNGNLPLVDGDDNDSMLLVAAGDWAVSDPATVKAALGLNGGMLGTRVILGFTDRTVQNDPQIGTLPISSFSYPDDVNAKVVPSGFLGTQFENDDPNVSFSVGSKSFTLQPGLWRVTAEVAISGRGDSGSAFVQWAITDTTSDGAAGHSNTVHMYGQWCRTDRTTAISPCYMQSRSVILDLSAATEMCLRAGSSGTGSSIENTQIIFERLGDATP